MFLGMPMCGAMCIWLPIGIMPGCMEGLLNPIMLLGPPSACMPSVTLGSESYSQGDAVLT